ncbi:hypothetical protein [Amycolatopsis sp. cmx-11-51]|uniref:hypothetical protein n=1 Tax=unclassified Amycolatopsis TaxID=2618356 RepID=UPI0039E5BBCB
MSKLVRHHPTPADLAGQRPFIEVGDELLAPQHQGAVIEALLFLVMDHYRSPA